ncbi:MAG TPA: cupin domain-containing protein [Candidatus Lokiarchaeia archaeon]|nr:cupin domain-containing protein [Candidatus Lokiarchaeia archaeon]
MRANKDSIEPVENPVGIFRRTLTWNEEVMLCHFDMKEGAQIPLHDHLASQNGFVISGKLRFITESEDFVVGPGDSYVFGPNEKHGADVLEDSEVIEAFAPARPEYAREIVTE